MAELWIETIGLVAGALGIVAWVPQIRDVWIHERHEGISLTTFSVVTVALPAVALLPLLPLSMAAGSECVNTSSGWLSTGLPVNSGSAGFIDISLAPLISAFSKLSGGVWIRFR